MLGRATTILEREMSKGGAAMLQVQNAASVAKTVDVMLKASLISTGDASKLTALVQEAQKAHDTDEDEAPGAPAGAIYESQSGGIVDVLQDLAEKAESQLADLRQKETEARHNFATLKQSLEDEIKFSTEDMADAKNGIAESSEISASAQGDLDVTSKEVAEDT